MGEYLWRFIFRKKPKHIKNVERNTNYGLKKEF